MGGGCAQVIQAENGRLWAALETCGTAQGTAGAGESAGSAAEVCEQYAAMCQRMEAVLRERADVAARLSAAQVSTHAIFLFSISIHCRPQADKKASLSC